MLTRSATEVVRLFRDGQLSFDELKRDFRQRTWSEPSWQAAYEKMSQAERWHEADGLGRSEPGTWGEVTRLYDTGELTRKEYYGLMRAVDAAHGDPDSNDEP